ncbi:MAG: DUF6132 family protein [Chthoniobacterales bacterium]
MKFVNLSLSWPLLGGLLLGALLGAALGYFGQCTSGTCPLTSTWWRGALYGAFLGLLFALSGPSPHSRDQGGQNPANGERNWLAS